MEEKKRRCHNCKYSGKQFKIKNLTHLHCENEKLYPFNEIYDGNISPWETLRVFNDTCHEHSFKDEKSNQKQIIVKIMKADEKDGLYNN